MTFAQPIFLTSLAVALPLLVLFLVWARRNRQQAIARLGNPALIERLSVGVNWRGRRWQNWLWLLTAVLVIFSLARPQWGQEEQTIEQRGVQVMVALDVSQSMLAADIKPNRLEHAKREIADMMQRLDGDEVGLVLFSGASFIQFPLTSDYNTARAFLDSAHPNVISRQGTNIGDAIRTALGGFDENKSSQKVIVLITDGENHEADTMAIAQQAADAGIMLYTIGFGSTEGEPIPEFDQFGNQAGFKTDNSGEIVLSKLDEATLQEIASVGGGQYYRATAGGSELDALVAELNTLQQGEIGTQVEQRGIERFQIFLGLALLSYCAMLLIRDRSRAARKLARVAEPTTVEEPRVTPQPVRAGV